VADLQRECRPAAERTVPHNRSAEDGKYPMDYQRLVPAIAEEMQSFFGRLACINAVAAAIDVVEKLEGIALRPLTVRAFIFNPALSARVGDFEAPDATASLQRWANEGDSFRVALGVGQAPAGDWAGHLVAVASDGDKSLVMDPTIHQADQPAHGIVLRPVLVRVADEHLEGRSGFRTHVNGCEILYKAFPDDRFFEQTPAWRNGRQRASVRDQVLRRLDP
jgi:hypothetical protein